MLYDGDTFTHNGREFRVTFPYDDAGDTPWEREEGHGEVSEWTRRGKLPGERVLATDRGVRRYYDFQGATAMARRDGWSFSKLTRAERAAGLTIEEARAKLTKRQEAARAVEEDFERLRQWCDNQWTYVGVVVEELDPDGEPTGRDASLWGVESDAGDYLEEVARDLADEIAPLAERHEAAAIEMATD